MNRGCRNMTKRAKKGVSVKTESLNPMTTKIQQLTKLFPGAFTEGKIDIDELEILLEGYTHDSPERYSFGWAGKKKASHILQAPTRSTLIPVPEESINWDESSNLFIEGDNLEVLKLFFRAYANRVKLIYIDPPYNTGNDFVYPDNFSDPLSTYLKLTGQVDEAGNLLSSNPETSGRYHSAWLTMMYPRLFLARHLLSDDGVIFVSIDDNELHNLRMLMNMVFGEVCFKNCIIFRRGIKSVQAQFETVGSLTIGHEYVLMYSRSPETRFQKLYVSREEFKPGTWNNHWRGTDRPTMRYELFDITPKSGQWRWSKARSVKAIENYKRMLKELNVTETEISQEQIDRWYELQSENTNDRIDLLRLSATGKPAHYVPPSDAKLGSDLWIDLSTRGTSELKSLFGRKVFDNPKPIELVKRMISFVTEPDEDCIVMDFFAGSCSTAHAVLDYNKDDGGHRRFIMIQLPESLREPIKLKDGTILHTIADLGKERIRRVIKKIKQDNDSQTDLRFAERPQDLGFRVYKLTESHIRSWNGIEDAEPDSYAEQMQLFNDPLVEKWTSEGLVTEIALKEAGFGLNFHIEKVSSVKKQKVMLVKDSDRNQEFYICLDSEFKHENIQGLELTSDMLFVCRAIALSNEDAANLANRCQLRTI